MGTKGGGWEWDVARKLSSWLTEGADDSQLIRSRASGAWATQRRKRGKKPRHPGDIAPADVNDMAEMVAWFCGRFLTECKAYKNEPDWWPLFREGGKPPVLIRWWAKAVEEAKRHGLSPLLIVRRNNRPAVVVSVGPLLANPAAYMVVHYHSYNFSVMPLWNLLDSNPYLLRNVATFLDESKPLSVSW